MELDVFCFEGALCWFRSIFLIKLLLSAQVVIVKKSSLMFYNTKWSEENWGQNFSPNFLHSFAKFMEIEPFKTNF